jgi:PAS domain-containing protein
MPAYIDRINPWLTLRHQAETRLRMGTAPKTRIESTSLEALNVLHNMVFDPAQASAAHKLLHELQVHQVEFDLQQEQLEQNRNDLSFALELYLERFNFAPFGYCALARDGKILEANLAAGDVFGVEPMALNGRRISSLVSAASRLTLALMLKRLAISGARENCEVEINSGSIIRRFQIVATAPPTSDNSLMMVFHEISH